MFFTGLGLEELAQDQPTGRDLLQEIFDEYDIEDFKNPEKEENFLYRVNLVC